MPRFLFVSGTMRSGTSMLSDILYSRHLNVARHPDIAFSMEGIPAYRNIMNQFWKSPGNKRLRYRPSKTPAMAAGPCDIPELGVVHSEQEFFQKTRQVIEAQILAQCKMAQVPSVVGLKYTNIFSEFNLFAKYFDDVSLVLLVRDPRNVFASHCIRKINGSLMDNLRILVDILALHEFIAANADSGRIAVVRYEDLLTEQERLIRAILTFVGVDPDRYDFRSLADVGMLKNSSFGERNPGAITTVKGGASGGEADRFLKFLAPYQTAFVERVCGHVFERYGYRTVHHDDEALARKAVSYLGQPLLGLMTELQCQRSMVQRVDSLIKESTASAAEA